MGSFGDYLENKMLDHVMGVTAYTPPPQTWIALSTADPSDDNSGLTEPGAGAYARVDYGDWSAAAARAVDNNAIITFPTATAGWGTITHYAIMDALTAGNQLAHGEFVTSKTVVTGNTPSINAGEIVVSFNASAGGHGFTTYLANAILDHVFENSAYSVPTIYIALSTTQPVDAGTGLTEPSGNNYARKAYSSWDTAALGVTENTGDINFNTPNGTWGLISNSAILDALTGGNLLMFGDVTDQTPGNGDPVKFPTGDLTITLT